MAFTWVSHGLGGLLEPEMPCEAAREPTVSSFHTTELSLGLAPRRSATFRFDTWVEKRAENHPKRAISRRNRSKRSLKRPCTPWKRRSSPSSSLCAARFPEETSFQEHWRWVFGALVIFLSLGTLGLALSLVPKEILAPEERAEKGLGRFEHFNMLVTVSAMQITAPFVAYLVVRHHTSCQKAGHGSVEWSNTSEGLESRALISKMM